LTQPILCIAGKSRAAVDVVKAAVALDVRLACLPNAGDCGEHDWQPSLLRTARDLGVELVDLDWAMARPNLTFVSVEYDRIVRPERFATTKLFNIHFSLLPKYRGCNTAIWPILHGEAEHGVTLHEIDAGIDTGPIIAQRQFAVEDGATSRDLYFRCLELGAALVIDWLPRLISGEYRAVPQPEEGASLFRRRDLDFTTASEVDFSADTRTVMRQIRAFTFPEYQLPTIDGAEIVAAAPPSAAAPAGEGTLLVPTADGAVRLRLKRPDLAEARRERRRAG